MKKLFCIVLSLVLMLSLAVPAFAAPANSGPVELAISDITLDVPMIGQTGSTTATITWPARGLTFSVPIEYSSATNQIHLQGQLQQDYVYEGQPGVMTLSLEGVVNGTALSHVTVKGGTFQSSSEGINEITYSGVLTTLNATITCTARIDETITENFKLGDIKLQVRKGGKTGGIAFTTLSWPAHNLSVPVILEYVTNANDERGEGALKGRAAADYRTGQKFGSISASFTISVQFDIPKAAANQAVFTVPVSIGEMAVSTKGSNIDGRAVTEYDDNEQAVYAYTYSHVQSGSNALNTEFLKITGKCQFNAFANEAGNIPTGVVAKSFADVQDGAWYFPYIQKASTYNLIAGTGQIDEDTGLPLFSPEGNLTLAQCITLVARMDSIMTGREIPTVGGEWYQPYVSYIRQNKMVPPGLSISKKTLGHYVSRAGFAKMVAELPFVGRNNYLVNIPDVADFAKTDGGAIFALYESGICNGKDAAGTFYPNSPLTRAEACTILLRILEPETRTQKENEDIMFTEYHQ